jgi:hypothetical protein
MTEITDEFMREMISQSKEYCVVILKAGPNRNKAGVEKIIWEQGEGTLNYELRDCHPLSVRSLMGAVSLGLESLMQIWKR